jgi:hypothetical protein
MFFGESSFFGFCLIRSLLDCKGWMSATGTGSTFESSKVFLIFGIEDLFKVMTVG